MSINNAETLPRPLLNTTCDPEQTRRGPVLGEEKPANISPRPGIIHESCLPRLFFVPSSHFSEQPSTWPERASSSGPVSNEVAGIENQIWREYSCNPLINWKFPKLARIKTSCISQGRRGDAEWVQEVKYLRWCFRPESVGGLETERGRGGPRVTCHLMIIH